MKLRDWPEFDLIRPAGANRLIVGFKTVRTIEKTMVRTVSCSDSPVVAQRFERSAGFYQTEVQP